MDSDLAESIAALRDVFRERRLKAVFQAGDDAAVRVLAKRLGLPQRYVDFLKAADPSNVETLTPTERIRLVPAHALEKEQLGYGRGDASMPAREGWRPGWIVIAHSTLLGDPYFLDTTRPDAEGDCPVMTVMNGRGLRPTLCASNFACFLRILATAMEVARGFAEDLLDPDDDDIFREALAPKLRPIDPAAARDRHWT